MPPTTPEPATEVYDDEGTCVLVRWPMNDYPDPAFSVTHGKSREDIVAWINNDPARAQVVLHEESDKFEQADVGLLWDCMAIIDPTVVRPSEV